jgi:hypothetical protein
MQGWADGTGSCSPVEEGYEKEHSRFCLGLQRYSESLARVIAEAGTGAAMRLRLDRYALNGTMRGVGAAITGSFSKRK